MISLTTFLLNFVMFSSFFSVQAINSSELLLYSDSLNCCYWTDYGISLQNESFSRSEWAFRKALSINPNHINAIRGLAVVFSARGNYNQALEELVKINSLSEPLSIILFISVCQELDAIKLADEYLTIIKSFQDPSIRSVTFLLEARQYLLEGDTLKAELLLDSCIIKGDFLEIITIAKIEKTFLSTSRFDLDGFEIINAFHFNISFLGGVYTELLLKYTNGSYDELLLPTRFTQCIYGNTIAFNSLPEELPEQLELNTRIWLAYLLFHLNKHNESMSLVDSLIKEDSTLVDPWVIKGLILLRNNLYFETIETMNLALRYNQDALEYSAIAGLSAEIAGYSKLSVETYCNILSLHPDSIVLINRMRNMVVNEVKDFNFNNDNFDNLEQTAKKWINGSLSFNYSSSSGDLDQYSFGSSFELSHTYGLYGSSVSTKGTLYKTNSSNDISGNQDINITLELLHQNSISTYSSYVTSLHDLQFITNSTQFQLSSAIGKIFESSVYFRFASELGAGVELNKWQENTGYHNDLVSILSLYVEFKGNRLSNLLPTTSLSLKYTQDIDTVDRYSLESGLNSTFRPTQLFSFLFGYSLNYFSSLPPEFENTLRTNSFAQIGISF